MAAEGDLSSLLALLYSAPLDESKWQSFLSLLCTTAQLSHSALIGQDDLERVHTLHAFAGPEPNPDVSVLYEERYGILDPYREPFFTRRPEGLIYGDAMVERDALKQSAFYNEAMRPHGLEHGLMFAVRDAHSLEVITLWRNVRQGAMDETSMQLLEQLLPHLQTALRLRRRIRVGEQRAEVAEAVLNRVTTAVMLVNARGEVVLTNEAAETILRQQDGLTMQQNQLTAAVSESQAELHRILAPPRNGGPAEGGVMLLLRPSGKPAYQLLGSPVQIGDRGPDAPWHLLLAISDPEQQQSPGLARTLQRLYGFTPAEAAVANELLNGLSPEEIASQRGVSIGTVRTQLKCLLTKTKTHRQGALLRLLSRAPELHASEG